jgi:hypothetical protein
MSMNHDTLTMLVVIRHWLNKQKKIRVSASGILEKLQDKMAKIK